jgi:hypothetical protein
VVLGEPEARVSEPLGVPREIERVVQRIGRRRAFGNGRKIQNRQSRDTHTSIERHHRPGFQPGTTALVKVTVTP